MLHTAKSYRGMVTSPHHLASQAGLSVLREGGNAIEASVAVAACLAVVYPHMNSIGGDGFWLIAEPDGSMKSIDACGSAANSATVNRYKGLGFDSIPWRGPLAANTVAGTVSGWQMALQKTNRKIPLNRLLLDAIFYAEEGVPVSLTGAQIAKSKDAELQSLFGYSDVFKPNGKPLREGDLLRQPALGRTLRRLVTNGLDDFYKGDVAEDIAADLKKAGSLIARDDLVAHKAIEKVPLSLSTKEAQLFNMGPPTQGFTSLLILALFDKISAEKTDGFDHVHGIVEATKQAFECYRKINLGDPDFMSLDAQEVLNDSKLLGLMLAKIDSVNAQPWPNTTQLGDTVWFGVVDGEGRSVSCIQSTYFEFGSGLVLPQTGIIWQNRGASFRLQENGWNALSPGRKPFHTLNPAMARLNDGRIMSYGTMGGEGQPQTQAAIFSRYARFDVPLQEAITAPRWLLGKTWGEESVSLKLENRFSEELQIRLKNAGHNTEILEPFTSVMGHAGALVRHPDGLIEGGVDPRSEGGVAAW